MAFVRDNLGTNLRLNATMGKMGYYSAQYR